MCNEKRTEKRPPRHRIARRAHGRGAAEAAGLKNGAKLFFSPTPTIQATTKEGLTTKKSETLFLSLIMNYSFY